MPYEPDYSLQQSFYRPVDLWETLAALVDSSYSFAHLFKQVGNPGRPASPDSAAAAASAAGGDKKDE